MKNRSYIHLIELFFIVFVSLSGTTSCDFVQRSHKIIEEDHRIEINNSKVKAVFIKDEGLISQSFYARKGDGWKKVVSAFVPPSDFPDEAVQLFDKNLVEDRYLSNSVLTNFSLEKKDSQTTVILKGREGPVPIEQRITLSGDNDYFHFSVHMELQGNPAKLDYALSVFTFNLDHAPTFVHTPGLKFDNEDSKQDRFDLLPGKDQVIGDRAFHAPAVILQEGSLFAALVPDLNIINEYKIISPDARRKIDIGRNMFSVPIEADKYTMPTGIDLNVKTGLTDKPVMTFGYMDNIIAHHIHYQRVNDTSMVRSLESNKLRYDFDLFVGADVPEYKGFQRITKYQWEKFGKPVFLNRPHLAMPFNEYFRIIDSITFHPISYEKIEIDRPLQGYEDNGSWLEWDEAGKTLGGYRSAISWWNDVLHNSAFWNNAREARGFWYWGHELDRPDMIKKGRSIINWCLSAPRNKDGLFALLYAANDKTWGLGFTDPVNEKYVFFLKESDSYDISTMSKTGAHLLDYYLRCERDERITEYLTPYANWLLSVIDERGAVPSYVDQRNMVASSVLHYSAQPASSLWFLAEMYNATEANEYLNGAKKIAGYIEREILPEQKWVDMEQFFSCGHRPFEFTRDQWQNQVARGNLSLFWAIEGYAALYRATHEPKYLKAGAQCIDYVTFSQACWEPHFVYTAFPFGGFTVDNTDNATFLDARQAEMVRPFIWYGKMLGRQDLLERGIAAARSSVVLMNHPRHKSNNIYRHTNIYPFGLGPENIDHEAHPQSAMRTHPSWGEGSGVFTGLAEARRGLGGMYLDFEKKLFVGVDGVKVMSATLEENTVTVQLENMLSGLARPWEKSYEVELNMQGLTNGSFQLIVNGIDVGAYHSNKLSSVRIKVMPDGSIALPKEVPSK